MAEVIIGYLLFILISLFGQPCREDEALYPLDYPYGIYACMTIDDF